MKIGYMRVSTDKQDTALQQDALNAYGVEKIYSDTDSGAKNDRVQYKNMLDNLRAGDTVCVWRLDRLSRSLKELISDVELFQQKNVGFVSLTESIDTSTPGGMLIFHIFGALAEFERELIRQRTRAGLAAAKKQGKVGGRRPATSKVSSKQIERARELYLSRSMTVPQIIRECNLKMSIPSFYKWIVNKKI